MRIFLILFLIVLSARAARADVARIDELLRKLDAVQPATASLTLNDCVALALAFNPELQQNMAQINAVMGDALVVRSRFGHHMDVVGKSSRNKGTMAKTYYPDLTPAAPAALGATSGSTSSSVSNLTSAANLSSAQLEQLAGGADVCQYSSLASQFGVDLTPFCGAKRMAAQIPGLDIAQLNQAIASLQTLSNQLTVTAAPPTTTATDWAVRYSRRLLEFGREPNASVTLRSNQKTAVNNYQQKLRDVLTAVRTAFFVILLKQDQIAEREKLLAEYENKYDRITKRSRIAQDVPVVDVLTAELDVLNERLRINTLRTELLNKQMELLQMIGKPLTARIAFAGEIEPFNYSVDDVIALTKQNSYAVAYKKFQLAEQERVIRELKWDYEPVYSFQWGVENRRSALGMSLNNSNQSYGLDLGALTYPNVPVGPAPSSLSSRDNTNYTVSLGVTYLLTDNEKKKGVKAKQNAQYDQMRAALAQAETTEELAARKAYAEWLAELERLKIQSDTVAVSKRRLEITRRLREYGKVQEFQVDNFRNQYFSDQDNLFREQETVITAQENLRKVMGVFY